MERLDLVSTKVSRPERVLGEVIDLLPYLVETPDQGLRLWALQDLNLQPTDYESAALTRLS